MKMLKKNDSNHLFYKDSTSIELSEVDKLKKDLLAIMDARCKLRIYDIINLMEE